MEIERLVDDFAALHALGQGHPEGPALAYDDPDTGWTVLPFYANPPLQLVFEVSEMAYNLKVALDYATYALFKQARTKGLISPSMFKSPDDFLRFEKDVQFPIMDTPKKFSKWADKNGKWIGRERTVFEEAQPYKRRFMRFLGDSYHNLDKHRDFQEFGVEIDLTDATFHPTQAVTTEEHLLKWKGIPMYGFETKADFPPNRPVAMYANGSVEISLPDGSPLVPTLKVLQSEVRSLIDALALAL